MGKLVVVHDLLTPAVLLTAPTVDIDFSPHFFMMGLTATSGWGHDIVTRTYLSMWFTNLHKITASPEGVAYPGDAVAGGGPSKVTVKFNNVLAQVIHNNCDYVDASSGWLVLTKGEHIVAYNPLILLNFAVEPS